MNNEGRRSHEGYTPQAVAENFILATLSAPLYPSDGSGLVNEREWFNILKRSIGSYNPSMRVQISRNGPYVKATLLLEDSDLTGLTPSERLDLIRLYPDEQIRDEYVRILYFNSDNTPNDAGIRQLLLILGIMVQY